MTAASFSIDALIEAAADRAAAKTLERAEEFMRGAPPTLLDTAGLARELGVSDVHIRKLVKAKKLPSIMVGDCRRYILADVLAALKEQRTESEETK